MKQIFIDNQQAMIEFSQKISNEIIENFEIQENEEFDISEDENTITILNRYIDESEVQFDKNIIKGILQNLYKEACEVE